MCKKMKLEEEFCLEVESIHKDLKNYTSIALQKYTANPSL